MEREIENPMVVDSIWALYERVNHDDDEDAEAWYRRADDEYDSRGDW